MQNEGLPFGPYVNRNHFAGFAELIIPVALVPLVLGKVRRERLFLVVLFALVPIVALLLSASRGGIVSFAVQMVVLFLLLLIRRTRSRHVLAGGLVVLCAVMAVSWGLVAVLSSLGGQVSFSVRAASSLNCQVFRGCQTLRNKASATSDTKPPATSTSQGPW